MWLRRWTGIGVLVAALVGANVAVAQADATGAALEQVDVATLVSKPAAIERAAFGWSDSRLLSVAAADDEDMDNEEEVEEEFEEDGLRPTGQGEQREQKKGERSETKNEDSGDTFGE